MRDGIKMSQSNESASDYRLSEQGFCPEKWQHKDYECPRGDLNPGHFVVTIASKHE